MHCLLQEAKQEAEACYGGLSQADRKSMKEHVCVPIGNQHDRMQFDCGVPVLDDCLAKYVKQDVKRKASAVFVSV